MINLDLFNLLMPYLFVLWVGYVVGRIHEGRITKQSTEEEEDVD